MKGWKFPKNQGHLIWTQNDMIPDMRTPTPAFLEAPACCQPSVAAAGALDLAAAQRDAFQAAGAAALRRPREPNTQKQYTPK